MTRLFKHSLLIVVIVFCLNACTKAQDDEAELKEYRNYSSKMLYQHAKEALNKNNYTDAIKRYEALETLYPFNPYAEKASLELIYAYYKNDEHPIAEAAAERYIRLYPRGRYVDYAYYMKGVANFEEKRGAFSQIFSFDPAWRAPGTQAQAYNDFRVLVKHYPQSPYAEDALQRMIYLRNMFARRELNIANYHLKRQMYVAAKNRAQLVVSQYGQAPEAKEALEVIAKATHALNFKQANHDANVVYNASYNHAHKRT